MGLDVMGGGVLLGVFMGMGIGVWLTICRFSVVNDMVKVIRVLVSMSTVVQTVRPSYLVRSVLSTGTSSICRGRIA